MEARAIGALCGVVIGLILSLILLVVCNKNRKIRTEYDERQKAVRGQAYAWGFFSAIAYFAVMSIASIMDVTMYVSDTVLFFGGIFFCVTVMAVYSIWKDAYWGLNNNRKSYAIVFIAAFVINLLVAIINIVSGEMVVDGVIQGSCVNLLCAVMFVVIGMTLLIKKAVKKEEED